jgi:hypothetical protein
MNAELRTLQIQALNYDFRNKSVVSPHRCSDVSNKQQKNLSNVLYEAWEEGSI